MVDLLGDIRETTRALRNSSDYRSLYINLLFKSATSIYFSYLIFLKVVTYTSKNRRMWMSQRNVWGFFYSFAKNYTFWNLYVSKKIIFRGISLFHINYQPTQTLTDILW